MSTRGQSIEGSTSRHDGLLADAKSAGGIGPIDLAFVLGAVIVSAVAYVVGIAPVRAAAVDDSRARAELVKLDTEKRKLAEDYRSRRAARDAAAQALHGSVRLVPETEINSRRAAIAALAEQSSIQIQATRPQVTLRGKRFDLVPIEIEGVGSATAFARFAESLRQRMPDTAIRSFALSSDAHDATPRFTALLVWYTLPEAMTKGTARATTESAARGSGEERHDRAASEERNDRAGAAGGKPAEAP